MVILLLWGWKNMIMTVVYNYWGSVTLQQKLILSRPIYGGGQRECGFDGRLTWRSFRRPLVGGLICHPLALECHGKGLLERSLDTLNPPLHRNEGCC